MEDGIYYGRKVGNDLVAKRAFEEAFYRKLQKWNFFHT
jgi:hypothetical protein